jgi:hypothetical protein
VSGSWLDRAGEASERALFARRARVLPPATVASLEAVLAAADAPARDDRPPAPRERGRAGAIVAFALVAAACAGGVVLVAARTAGQRRAPLVAADFDAAAPAPAGWTAAPGAMCEPASPRDEEDRASCLLQASFVLASSDDGAHACFQPEKPVQPAALASMSVGALACERGPEMSYR